MRPVDPYIGHWRRKSSGGSKLSPDKYEDNRPNQRENNTGGVKVASFFRVPNQTADESAYKRPCDSQQNSGYAAHRVFAGHDEARQRPNDQSNNNPRDYMVQ